MLTETVEQLRQTQWQGERLSETVAFVSDDDQLDQFIAILDSVILPRLVVFRDKDEDFIAFTVANAEILQVEHDLKISAGSSFMLYCILKDFAASEASVDVLQFPLPHGAISELSGTRVENLRPGAAGGA